ncbi:MAG: hydantoinase/oxoprolinase family protein, partial [Burkholderiales bacterium]
VKTFKAAGVEAIAVALLYSVLNDAHERRTGEIVRRLWPEVWVSISSDVVPILGEYERSSTTVLNCYVAQRVVAYLRTMDRRLRELGLKRGILLVQSNGGVISVDRIASRPVNLVLSGPAAGVGALDLYRPLAGSNDLIAMEIGGTSCDVTMMSNAVVQATDQLLIGGYHVSVPAVEIYTVGAGGGTIAAVDAAGLLTVGPGGAGAQPGPAAYGLGGQNPTVTDALLVLGRLRSGPLAGGAVSLDMEKAVAAIRRNIAQPLKLGVREAAVGIVRLLEQNLLHAVETISTERGYNPRRFTLVACGGAGPMHGVSVARALGCARVYVPRQAGAFCAIGMLHADLRQDFQRV